MRRNLPHYKRLWLTHLLSDEVEHEKGLTLTLQDAELIELCRVLIDKDAEGALEFLQAHLKGKARDLLEGG